MVPFVYALGKDLNVMALPYLLVMCLAILMLTASTTIPKSLNSVRFDPDSVHDSRGDEVELDVITISKTPTKGTTKAAA